VLLNKEADRSLCFHPSIYWFWSFRIGIKWIDQHFIRNVV